jgi:ribose transport system permease protein
MNRGAFSFFKWLGFIVAAIVAGVSVILGAIEDVPMQTIIFYALAIFSLILWGWHQLSVSWIYRDDAVAVRNTALSTQPAPGSRASEDAQEVGYLRALIANNKGGFIGLLIVAAVLVALAFAIDGFFEWRTLLSFLVLVALLIIAFLINKFVTASKSIFIGLTVLIGLFIVGSLSVEGFLSILNFKSMLVFAAFLGLACIGQTLVVLLGGLDLSIPFVIGSSNIGLMYLLTLGVPPWLAFIAIILIGGGIGLINGFLSFRLQGQALILTLGTGFAVSGGTQILTSIGTAFGGNVFGVVPDWLSNIASINGIFFGLHFPPVNHPDRRVTDHDLGPQSVCAGW